MRKWCCWIGIIGIAILLLARPYVVGAQATSTFTPTHTNTPLATQYQSGCSLPFNPCGALPWSVPKFATVALRSPTAINTLPTPTPVPASATPTYTYTPTYTNTPSLTPTGTIATPAATVAAGGEGIATLADNLGDMAQTLSANLTQQVLIDGTPTGPEQIASDLGNYAGQFFGVVRAFQAINSFTFGIFGFLLVVLAFILMVVVTTTIGSMMLAFVRLILNLWSSIKPLCILFIVGLLALSALPATPAHAQGATPTVTPYPIPTREFSDLRPTPSPWAITPSGSGLDIDGDSKAGELADTMINGYRWLNFGSVGGSAGVVDFVIFIAMGFMLIRALMALIQGTGEEDE